MRKVLEIRQKYRAGDSINAIAKECKCSWETARKITLLSDEEAALWDVRPRREGTVITKEVIEAVEKILDTEDSLNIKKKQRKTGIVIFRELSALGVYKGCLKGMQELVTKLKRERGTQKVQSYLPLEFSLGSVFQIDHGEVDLIIDGKRCLGYMFAASVPGFCLRYCQIFPTKNSEAWGEFHERAFVFFGGIPQSCMYDNDSVLVHKILGRERAQTFFSHQLETQYGISSRFCNPASGNEKGAVENTVGYGRRNFLHGRPEFASWELANQHLETACKEDIRVGRHYKDGRAYQEIYDEMKKKLKPLLPSNNWCRKEEVKVNSYQLVTVDKRSYSVPQYFVGKHVQVQLSVMDVNILYENGVIAKHSRLFGDPETSISYDIYHYLEELKKKPGALWDCQVIQRHGFPQEFLELRRRLEKQYPQQEANKQFIDILLFVRNYFDQGIVLKALKTSLELNTITPSCIFTLITDFECQKNAHDFSYYEGKQWECNTQQYGELSADNFEFAVKEVKHA